MTLRCDIPVVLVKSRNYTADASSQNTILYTYIYIYIYIERERERERAAGGNS